MNPYTPQPVPSVTTPELRHWLDLEHRRLAQIIGELGDELGLISLGVTLSGRWRFTTDTTEVDPGSGRVAYNNAAPGSVTEIYISEMTQPGADATRLFQNFVKVGARFYLQQLNDASRYLVVDVASAPTDNGTWWTIPVSVVANGLLPINNSILSVILNTDFDTTRDYRLTGEWEFANLVEFTFDPSGGPGAIFYASGGGSDAAIQIKAIQPSLNFWDTDAATDEKSYDISANGGLLSFRLVNDANSAVDTWLSVDRTGYQSTTVTLHGDTITLDGHAELSTMDATGLVRVNTIAGLGEDDYFSLVRALLHFDGSDASTTFTDQIGNTWSGVGNAQLDTAQKKFGTASLLLDGAGDYITTPDNNNWSLGTQDFTIEAWVRYNVAPTNAAPQCIASHYLNTGNQRAWFFSYGQVGDVLRFFYSTDGSSTANLTAAWTPATGTWYHLAVARQGNTLRLFIDGALVASGDVTGISIFNSNQVLTIGRLNAAGFDQQYHNGWIDDFRFTVGQARYTADFTPPTAAHSDSGGTTDVLSGLDVNGLLRVGHDGVNGYATINHDNTTGTPGFVEFFTGDGTRRGYIGYNSASRLIWNTENSWGAVINAGGELVFNTSTASTLYLQTNNTERLRITSAGAWGLGGANFGTSGQVLKSNGSGSAPTWGTDVLIRAQAADIVLTNQTTYQDTDLSVALEPGDYLIESTTLVDVNPGPGVKTTCTFTGTATNIAIPIYSIGTGANPAIETAFGVDRVTSLNGVFLLRRSGRFTVTAPGVLTLKFAQDVLSAQTVTFKAGSVLRIDAIAA